MLLLLRRRPSRRRPSLTGVPTRRSRASHPDVALTFDDMLQDLDPGWRAIDWSEVEL